MRRFAAISSNMVVGVLNASTPPTVNVPVGWTFIDITDLPNVTMGWRYEPGTGVFFEEAMTPQKQQFLDAMQAQMTEMGTLLEKSRSMVSAFVDRGYDAAAADPISDQDLADFGVIQFYMGAAINLLQAFDALIGNNPTFEAAVSKWRKL